MRTPVKGSIRLKVKYTILNLLSYEKLELVLLNNAHVYLSMFVVISETYERLS